LRALTKQTDERLLIEAAQRDPTHFAELYEANFDRVYAFLARRVRNREEAQDLTAEVFHQALAGISRFQWQGAPFAAWLLGIAANVLADRWQHVATRQEVATEDAPEPAGIGDEAEKRAMLTQLVESLPQDQQYVIVRRFVDQQSLREIAQELGRTEGAVKQLQFRALQSLRTLIRSNYG
jgi:RNA polymerase sigma-70 factor (ECF subfamily)